MSALPHLLANREHGSCTVGQTRRVIGGAEQLVHKLELQRKLAGHDGCVNTIQFSPCGELLVSGSDDQDIAFWDWQSGDQRLSYFSGHSGNVFQARILPESGNSTVVSCAADGQVRVGHIPPGSSDVQTKRLAAHAGRAHKLALYPGSPQSFMSCGEDGEVRMFDLREPPPYKRRLMVCCAFPGRALELHSVHCNPALPSQFCVGGSDEIVRVFDLRNPSRPATATLAVSVANPLRQLSPPHLRGRGAGSQNVSITCAVFDQLGNILASYNDENLYLLAGERARVRRRAKGAVKRGVRGKRVRSTDGSQQPARRGSPAAGHAGAAKANDAAAAAADGRTSAAAAAAQLAQEQVEGDDDAPPGLISVDSAVHRSSDGPPGLEDARQLPGSPLQEVLSDSQASPSASSSEHEGDWHTDSGGSAPASQLGGGLESDSSSSGEEDEELSEHELFSDEEEEYDGWEGWGGDGGLSDVDSLPPLCSEGSQRSGSDCGDDGPSDADPVLQCFRGARNRQTVKGCAFMGPAEEWVVAGSDCGHIFIWSTASGQVQCMLKGDHSVVNCLEPHPYHPFTLATSGIENDVKIWAPTGPPRPPGQAAQRRMQRNAQHQGAGPAAPPPLLMQHLLNDPHLLTQVLAQMATGAGHLAAGPQVSDEWHGEEEEDDEEDGEDEDEDDDDEGWHPPQPECSVQ